jgi:hypothetical protein
VANVGFTVRLEKTRENQLDFESKWLNNHTQQVDGNIDAKNCCSWVVEQCAIESGADCHFVSQLVDLIEDGLKRATDNTLISAHDFPLHGTF